MVLPECSDYKKRYTLRLRESGLWPTQVVTPPEALLDPTAVEVTYLNP